MDNIAKWLSDLDKQSTATINAVSLARQISSPIHNLVPKSIAEMALTPSPHYKTAMDLITATSFKTPVANMLDWTNSNKALSELFNVSKMFENSYTNSDFYKTFNMIAKSNSMAALTLKAPASLVQTMGNLDRSFLELHKIANIGSDFKGISNLVLSALPYESEWLNFEGEDETEVLEKNIQKLADIAHEFVENVPTSVDSANEALKRFTTYIKEFLVKEDIKLIKDILLPLTWMLAGYFLTLLNASPTVNNYTTKNYYITKSGDNGVKLESVSSGKLIINSVVKEVQNFRERILRQLHLFQLALKSPSLKIPKIG